MKSNTHFINDIQTMDVEWEDVRVICIIKLQQSNHMAQ